MAITRAEFVEYLPAVKFTISGTDYTLPIWNLMIQLVPWVGSKSTEQELVDGYCYQKLDGWRIAAQFDMNFGHLNGDNCIGKSVVEGLLLASSGTLDLDPVSNPGDRVLTVVMENADDAITAVFKGHIRNRPFRMSVVTKDLFATGAIPSWLATDPAP